MKQIKFSVCLITKTDFSVSSQGVWQETLSSTKKGGTAMFRTGSNKSIEFCQIPDAILAYYEKNKGIAPEFSILIGTDSQNFDQTKCVSVICVIAKGKGGIFFYEVSRIPLIRDVRRKLHIETNDSLNLATALVDALEAQEKYHDMYLSVPISIHIDAGNSERGKTKELIPELVGWVRASGYDAETKPQSFVASCVADRLSK